MAKIIFSNKFKGSITFTLVNSHQEINKAEDLCYLPQPFPYETNIIEFLFELYEKYTQPLMAKTKSKKK